MSEAYLNSIAVTGYVVVVLSPVPVFPQDIRHEITVGARGSAVQSIVRAHDGPDLGVSGTLLEGGQIILGQVLHRHDSIEAISDDALPAFQVVCGVVFAGGNHLPRFRVVALETGKKVLDISLKPDWVFSWSLSARR